MKTALSAQVESLTEWAHKRAQLTRSRHYVRGVRTGYGAWYYVADAYDARVRLVRDPNGG